jgi:hypothetical protein
MGARFFEDHFHLSALDEAIENKSRRCMDVGAQQSLRFE